MPATTVTSKGRITIPKGVRDALGLEPGRRVFFHLREEGVAELHPETVDLLSLCAVFKPRVKGVTLDDMEEAIRQGAKDG